MLVEYKKLYEEQANQIKGWKKLSISELCYKYISTNKTNVELANAYISALISRYLSKIIYEYNSQTSKVLYEDDLYDMLIDTLQYVLEKRVWDNPDSKLYREKDAPEIAINMALKTSKVNLYIFKQRDKRKLNQNILSLQELEERSADGFFIPYHDRDISLNLYIQTLMNKYFKKKEYEKAFILDSIISNDVLTGKNNSNSTVSFGKIRSSIHKIDNIRCDIFSREYNIDINTVLASRNYVIKSTDKKIDNITKKLLLELKADSELKVLLNAC